MRRTMIALAAAIATGVAAADENDWVYTPETHATIAPARAESATAFVDSSFWSSGWSVWKILFGRGFAVVFR